MDYHLFGFDRPIDDNGWHKQARLRFSQINLFDEDRLAIRHFLNFIKVQKVSGLTIHEPVPEQTLCANSPDTLLVSRLCAIGLLKIETKNLFINWSDESAAFVLAHFLADEIDCEMLSCEAGCSLAVELDRIFQTRLITPLRWAFNQAAKKEEILGHCAQQIKILFSTTFYTGHVIPGSATDPEFPWDQQLKAADRGYHQRSSSEEEQRFIFFLEIISHLNPKSIADLYALCNSPVSFLTLLRRIKLDDPLLYREPVRSNAASFLAWAMNKEIEEAYNRWTHEAHSWRRALSQTEAAPTSIYLLEQKAKLDEWAIGSFNRYIDSLPKFPSPTLLHATLVAVDGLLTSMRMRWQNNRFDTDGIREAIKASLAARLNILVGTAPQNLEVALSSFLAPELYLDERFAIVADLGGAEAAFTPLKSLIKDSILKRCQVQLSQPFKGHPHFFHQNKQKFDVNLRILGQFLLDDEATISAYVKLLSQASEQTLVGPESEQNQETHRQENLAYFVRIVGLIGIKHITGPLRKKVGDTLRSIYKRRVMTAYTFGANSGLADLLTTQKIIKRQEKPKPSRWSSREVRNMPIEKKRIYSRHLINEGAIKEAKALIETYDRPLWKDANAGSGQNSESIYNWMLTLVRSHGVTQRQFADAVEIFEKSRGCVGVDAEQAYTLASVMAEKGRLFPKAIEFIDYAIKQNPGNLVNWANKIILLLKAGYGTEAFKVSESIPKMYQSLDHIAHLRLATQVAAIESLPQMAIRSADDLLSKNKEDYEAMYRKAVANVYEGKFGDAITLGKLILRKFPKDKLTKALLAKLKASHQQQNIEILTHKFDVSIPARIGGEWKVVPVRTTKVGKEKRVVTKIALAQVPLPEIPDGKTFTHRNDAAETAFISICQATSEARAQGGKVLFLPEASIPHEKMEEIKGLAQKEGLWIVGGVRHRQTTEGWINQSAIISPEGKWFDGEKKVAPAPNERELFPEILSGDGVQVFTGTPLGRIAVLICFDFYSPELRTQLRDQADLLFVPMANRDTEKTESAVISASSDLGMPVVCVNAVGFGRSYYSASCIKKVPSAQMKILTHESTPSELLYSVRCLDVPDGSMAKEFHSRRPYDKPKMKPHRSKRARNAAGTKK